MREVCEFLQGKDKKRFRNVYLINDYYMLPILPTNNKPTRDTFKAIYPADDGKIYILSVDDFDWDIGLGRKDFLYGLNSEALDRDSVPEEVVKLLDEEIEKRHHT